MWAALKESWALFIGILMLMMANGLLATLLTIQGVEIGFSEATIGIIQAGYPLGALFGAVLAPRLVEHVGHVRAFGALASLCSVSAIIHLLTADVVSWTAMRFLAGFCFPGLYVVAESWLNAKAHNHLRGTILSMYFVTQTLGAAMGQSLLSLEGISGSWLFGVTSILISLSLVPLLITRTPAPDYHAPERLRITMLVRISPTAMFGALINGVMQAAFYVALPLYGLAIGMSAPDAAGLLVVGTIAGAAAQFPIGWLSDRIDRRLAIAAPSLLCLGVCLALISGWLDDYIHLGVGLIAALTLPIYSLCVAHANDHLKPTQIVPASGTLVLTLNGGILIGAFAGPFAIGQLGGDGFLSLLAVCAALTAVVALVRQATVASPEDTGEVQAIAAQGAQQAGVLHPDSSES